MFALAARAVIRTAVLVSLVMQAGQGEVMRSRVAVAADSPLYRRQATRLITDREFSLQQVAAVVGTKATTVPMVVGSLAPTRSVHLAKSALRLLFAAPLEQKEALNWQAEQAAGLTLHTPAGARTAAGDQEARPVAPMAVEEAVDTMGAGVGRRLEGPAVRTTPRTTRWSSGTRKGLPTPSMFSAGRTLAATATRPSVFCRRTISQTPRRRP